MDSLSSEGFELDFSHLYALHWYFILKIVSWDVLDPTIMNQLPLKKKSLDVYHLSISSYHQSSLSDIYLYIHLCAYQSPIDLSQTQSASEKK